MPKVSPIKHFAFKQKEKEKEKGSPQKLRGSKIIFVSKTKGGEKRKEDEKVEKNRRMCKLQSPACIIYYLLIIQKVDC